MGEEVWRQEEEKKEKEMKLDLACGNNKKSGFVGVDITKDGTQADVECDLEKYPWLLKDDLVEEIMCSHWIEHTEDLIAFMNECWRVMKQGAMMTLVAPYWSSIRAWQDPTHKRAISEATFVYFCKEWREKNKLGHYPIKTDFKIVGIQFVRNNDFHFTDEETLKYASRHYLNVYDDIIVTLQK